VVRGLWMSCTAFPPAGCRLGGDPWFFDFTRNGISQMERSRRLHSPRLWLSHCVTVNYMGSMYWLPDLAHGLSLCFYNIVMLPLMKLQPAGEKWDIRLKARYRPPSRTLFLDSSSIAGDSIEKDDCHFLPARAMISSQHEPKNWGRSDA